MKRLMPVFTVFATVALGARIELHDGRSIDTEKPRFYDSYLVTDQETIPRSQIRNIVFTLEGGQATGAASADDDVQKLLDLARNSCPRFPDSKGILLIDDGRNTLHEDRTRNYSYRMAYLVLSEARKDIGTFRHYYQEGDNEVKIHFARVIKPSGRVIELDPASVKIEVPPREDIVFFGKGKWITFTLPEIEIGDIIEYSYENIRFNPWNKDFFTAGYFFQGEDPYIYSRLVVEVPKDEYIKWKLYDTPEGMVNFTEQEEGSSKIYTWMAENVPPYIPEPNSPPAGDYLPRVDITNLQSWDALFDWYAGFEEERIKVTPQIQALVDSLITDAQTEDEKVAPIYHWLQQNIRYISIKGGAASGVSGHPAGFTLERGFGDCADKSILFSTMLEAAGIDSDPVSLGTNDEYEMLDPEMPGPYGNHAINKVFLSDTSFYLDATGGDFGGFSRYPAFDAMDQGVYSLDSRKREIEIIPVRSPENELRQYNLDLEIDEEGTLIARYQSFYEGDYETYLRYYWNYFSREEDRRLAFEQMVKRTSPDAELTSYELVNTDDIAKQMGIRMTYRIPGWVKFAGPVAIIRLPEVGERLTFDEVSLEKRNYPLAYPASEGIQHNITLKLPENWKIDYLPEEVELARPEVSYRVTYAEEEANLIRFEDFYARAERLIQPESYPAYKKLLNSITSYHEKPILVLVEER
ncbi:DUF3857 domain-containing protein [candidate division WOR-3 bacterium]|nr:DUF3857 domain-containing protein [candidate division WOR-3 bacterium]